MDQCGHGAMTTWESDSRGWDCGAGLCQWMDVNGVDRPNGGDVPVGWYGCMVRMVWPVKWRHNRVKTHSRHNAPVGPNAGHNPSTHTTIPSTRNPWPNRHHNPRHKRQNPHDGITSATRVSSDRATRARLFFGLGFGFDLSGFNCCRHCLNHDCY